jgi:hypothetical protein
MLLIYLTKENIYVRKPTRQKYYPFSSLISITLKSELHLRICPLVATPTKDADSTIKVRQFKSSYARMRRDYQKRERSVPSLTRWIELHTFKRSKNSEITLLAHIFLNEQYCNNETVCFRGALTLYIHVNQKRNVTKSYNYTYSLWNVGRVAQSV